MSMYIYMYGNIYISIHGKKDAPARTVTTGSHTTERKRELADTSSKVGRSDALPVQHRSISRMYSRLLPAGIGGRSPAFRQSIRSFSSRKLALLCAHGILCVRISHMTMPE
jgi:hypothetical protein